jgi:SAM-dependent methyltransferase
MTMPDIRTDQFPVAKGVSLPNLQGSGSGMSLQIPSPPEEATQLRQRQRCRREALAPYFDALADDWDRYRARNRYFHRTQRALFRTYVPAGMSVLELGCATGDLLAIVKPRRGLGIDLSGRMVDVARRKYPEFEFRQGDGVLFDTLERFDCILVNNLLEYISMTFKVCFRTAGDCSNRAGEF